jgi:hypothetical protein
MHTNLFHALTGHPPCRFSVTDTHRPTVIPVEGTVFGTQVQLAVVEQQLDRNGADLAVLCLLRQGLVQGMQQPAIPALYLGGEKSCRPSPAASVLVSAPACQC